MSEPEQLELGLPALFDGFSPKRTRGQRRRSLRHAVISPLYRVYVRLRGGER
jgi:hypothetical protein